MIESPEHALFVGAVIGLAARRQVYLRPVPDADGNWSDELQLSIPGLPDVRITVIVPPPPAGWTETELFRVPACRSTPDD